MTTGHVFIATSLDGFIARPDGSIDWLPGLESDPGENYGYDDFLATVDGLVMGRGAFEKVLEFGEWPYPKPVIVLTRSLDGSTLRADLRDKVEFSALTPRELMDSLGARGWNRVYVDGGKIIQAFLREGLIADMVVTRVPVLIGDGLPLFGAIGRDIRLTHRETRGYPSGLVQSRYTVD
ncbi:MAG: dihydrofolate reductase family protein [Rhizobium sp.]|nr:dihydrofolate reductase family protein [Rhizobium sp.]